jgi:hypothetical protein
MRTGTSTAAVISFRYGLLKEDGCGVQPLAFYATKRCQASGRRECSRSFSAVRSPGGNTSTLPRQMWNDLLLQVNPTLAAVSTVILVFVTVFIVLAETLRRRATARAG